MNFVAILLLSFFISVKSSNATRDETFHKNSKINVKSSNATRDETFHKNSKINVKSSNATRDETFHKNSKINGLADDTKQENQLSRQRRSVVSLAYSNNPFDCYRQFFVNYKPPVGFQSSTKDANDIRYICQTSDSRSKPLLARRFTYSTMFDLGYKIPVYSAYVVPGYKTKDFGSASRVGKSFRRERDIPGYKNRGKLDLMYSDTGRLPCIHKGHLVPAEIYSFDEDRLSSTFTYTNAVPQYASFNSGQWSKYERRIKKYARNACSKEGWHLYLLTGTSNLRIIRLPNNKIKVEKKALEKMPEEPNIAIPNSMWTAGCCVSLLHTKVFGSFAVMGNNDPVKQEMHMTKMRVETLEQILKKQMNIQIELFPGQPLCSDPSKDVDI